MLKRLTLIRVIRKLGSQNYNLIHEFSELDISISKSYCQSRLQCAKMEIIIMIMYIFVQAEIPYRYERVLLSTRARLKLNVED